MKGILLGAYVMLGLLLRCLILYPQNKYSFESKQYVPFKLEEINPVLEETGWFSTPG